MTRLAIFLAGLVTCCLHECGPAVAAERDVTPELVCAVQAAIRFREPAWTAEKCARVAAALNVTVSPRTLLSIAVNESDLRERAIAWHGPNVVDVGLLGIRCILDHGVCTNGPARGYTVAQLRTVETNIAVGNVLLVSLGGNVQRWNARSKGYAARIRALVAALDGRRVNVESRRVRKLIGQIIEAAKKGQPRS